MISPERLDQFQRQWATLLGPFGVAAADAYPVFDRLVAAYTEPHRHYHTLEHLGEMFRVVARLPVANPQAVQLAVWFHDVVYDPRAKDNEDQSAVRVAEWLAPLGVPPDVLARVAELVRATAHLAADAGSDADTDALLDADLAILAAAEHRYQRYAADIRREYAWVPEDAYRTGRLAVLESFLARPRLFRTELMFAEGEAAARRNLTSEAAALRAG
jgi:predicted metal-dependent HD superfamily phosphohydrolase